MRSTQTWYWKGGYFPNPDFNTCLTMWNYKCKDFSRKKIQGGRGDFLKLQCEIEGGWPCIETVLCLCVCKDVSIIAHLGGAKPLSGPPLPPVSYNEKNFTEAAQQ